MWQMTADDVESIAIGAGILGTGGGGNPYLGKLRSQQAIADCGPVTVLSPEELDDDAQVMCVGFMGAPTVTIEKITGREAYYSLKSLEEYTGKKVSAIISNEIGGSNSIETIIPATLTGLPIVDGDGMGRAFPELQMKSFFTYGVQPTPLAVSDEKGNTALITDAIEAKWVERMARAVTIQMGSAAGYAFGPMSAEQVRKSAIPNTITLAKTLGESVRRARAQKEDIVSSIISTHPGRILFQGKIVDVERRTTAGFARGKMELEGMNEYKGTAMSIEFQNENLIAWQGGEVVCMVPDLICIVDQEQGEPITTELLRYGFRVTVLGFPSDELWKTEKGLEVVGPRAFGYDLDYSPLELD